MEMSIGICIGIYFGIYIAIYGNAISELFGQLVILFRFMLLIMF